MNRGRAALPSRRRSGSTAPSLLGVELMLDFRVDVSLGGEVLTDAEIEGLLAAIERPRRCAANGVEVDAERLRATFDKFQAVERLAKNEGCALRRGHAPARGCRRPSLRSRGDGAMGACDGLPRPAEALAGCRSPEGLAKADPGAVLKASLRPYQQVGVRWLSFLIQLGLGACLADDMGLGQDHSKSSPWLLTLDRREANAAPSLLVARPPRFSPTGPSEGGRASRHVRCV